ncbi:hypothetical protein MESS2_1000058 [Mesorhizobium metallidurans STM 2683]|uniref:Transposase n=1 Tax=Mesorhizobium metallidurans STM 2683 TaxID=1297569 RepID=M5EEG5_9HYPH|nr:hypothetical protein MESS2_1000058 [Mesorhizobium metallidurans STM 2683]
MMEARWFCRKRNGSHIWHEALSFSGSALVMFKGCHFDRSVILLCVRWYLAYNLGLRVRRR